MDDPRTELLYSPFHHATVARNTASLWGRRVVEVSLCANVAVARSDLGELFVWGGTSPWWHQVGLRFEGVRASAFPALFVSLYFFCVCVFALFRQVEEESLYRGQFRGLTTPRSQLLLQTTAPAALPDDEPPAERLDPDDAECVK